jgi:hypothetical protein
MSSRGLGGGGTPSHCAPAAPRLPILVAAQRMVERRYGAVLAAGGARAGDERRGKPGGDGTACA